MAQLAPIPVFFDTEENLNAAERLERKQREQTEIIRWKHRFHKLDAIKPGETLEAFQIRCLNKRLVHLEREKSQKELQLKISNAPVHRREADILRGFILRMLDDAVRYERQIEAAKTDMNELTSQIKRASNELDNATKTVPSDFVFAESLAKSRRQLSAIESRLHNARLVEGKLHTENRKQRTVIENMLVDRKLFHQQWQQYVGELNRNRKFLLDMIERATLAFNQGEDLCHRIDALKAQENKDKRVRLQQMVEVERQIEGTRHDNEFLRTKQYQRSVAELDPRLVRKRNIFKDIQRETINRFGVIVDDAKNYLQLDAVQAVLLEMEKQQDKYMALFKYMNATNANIEEANAIARDLEKDSERLHEGERRKRLSDERHVKSELQQLRTTHMQTMELQQEVRTQQEALEMKLGIVEQALSLVGCDREEIGALMTGCDGSSERNLLSEDNLMKALSTIERKVLDLVQLTSTWSAAEEDPPVSGLYGSQQCAECAEGQDVNQHDERIVLPKEHRQLLDNVHKRSTAPEMQYRLHTLSQCKLPRSRMLVNKRYQ
uniref:ODAD1 central coiled coil region domain-containing protein n=1 Tax=Anopheles farauti TaxID=69004 RepID=A0A182QPG9_9DIPT